MLALKEEGEAYYKVLEDMVAKFARPEEGQMLLSANDFDQAPAGFAQKIEAAAKKLACPLSQKPLPRHCTRILKDLIWFLS